MSFIVNTLKFLYYRKKIGLVFKLFELLHNTRLCWSGFQNSQNNTLRWKTLCKQITLALQVYKVTPKEIWQSKAKVFQMILRAFVCNVYAWRQLGEKPGTWGKQCGLEINSHDSDALPGWLILTLKYTNFHIPEQLKCKHEMLSWAEATCTYAKKIAGGNLNWLY